MADPLEDELRALGVVNVEDALAALGVVDAGPQQPDASSVAPKPFGPQPNPAHRPSAGGALVHSIGNAIGTGDFMGAALQGALSEVTDIPALVRGDLTLGDLKQRSDRIFRDARADNLSRTRRGFEEQPVAAIAGRLLPGAVLAPALGPGATLAAAAGTSAAFGGLEGAAQSDAEDVPGLLKDTGTGIAVGAASGPVGYGIGRYALAPAGAWVGQRLGQALSRGSSSLTNGLRRFGQERALKAAGYIQKDLPKERQAYERLLGDAQQLLDEPGLIRPGSSATAIGERLEQLVDREGQRIGGYLDEADAAAWRGTSGTDDVVRGAGFNPYEFAEVARREVATPFTRNPSLRTEGEGVSRWIDDLLSTERAQAAEGAGISFRQANTYKGDLQNKVFNPQGSPRANKAAQNQLQRVLTRAIDEQAEPLIGSAGVSGFRDARRRYGIFQDALEQAQQQTNREVGNNFLSLADQQMGQTVQQGLRDVPYVGPAVALGSKLLRGRMDSAAARGADAAARSETLQTLVNATPDQLGGYGAAVGGVAGQSVADSGALERLLRLIFSPAPDNGALAEALRKRRDRKDDR